MLASQADPSLVHAASHAVSTGFASPCLGARYLCGEPRSGNRPGAASGLVRAAVCAAEVGCTQCAPLRGGVRVVAASWEDVPVPVALRCARKRRCPHGRGH